MKFGVYEQSTKASGKPKFIGTLEVNVRCLPNVGHLIELFDFDDKCIKTYRVEAVLHKNDGWCEDQKENEVGDVHLIVFKGAY